MMVQEEAKTEGSAALRDALSSLEKFLKENPQIQYLDCVFSDICGMIRGKRVPRADLEGLFTTGILVPGSIYFLDARGSLAGQSPGQFATLPASGMSKPVQGTLSRVSWSHRPHGQVLMSMFHETADPYFAEPRNVLRRVVERFAIRGISVALSASVDFWLVDQKATKNGVPALSRDSASASAELPALTTGPAAPSEYPEILSGIRDAAQTQLLPEIRFEPGASPGQFRASFGRVGDPLRAGDHFVFLRQVIRAVSRQFQFDATFMAKPFLGNPGNGMTLRIDLVDADGRPMFSSPDSPLSDASRHALGGLQTTMAESVAIMAPNVNAYRRFGECGDLVRNRRWGKDQASANFGLDFRLSGDVCLYHRFASADANPYLVIATILAGVHHGLEMQCEANAPMEGDAGTFHDPTLPLTMDAALISLENGSVLREYLMGDYVDRYCHTKRAELERFRDHISPHEYEWYL